jgi:pimeloyl-ACP methyl ester carboxylesterase
MNVRRLATTLSVALVSCAVLLSGCESTTRTTPPPYDPVTMDPPVLDAAQPATAMVAAIPSDGENLIGYLFFADGAGPHPTAVLLEGYPGGFGVLDLTSPLRRDGWNVLMFHYRGAWGTGGDTTLGHALDDVKAVLNWLRTGEYEGRPRVHPRGIALVGHSTGASLALLTAAGGNQLAAVVSIAPFNFGQAGRDIAGGSEAFDYWVQRVQSPAIHLDAGGRTLVQEMADRAADFDLVARAPELAGQPVLIVGGMKDTVCALDEHIRPLVRAIAASPQVDVTLIELDTDHSFWDKRVALARAVLGWLNDRVR